MIDERATVLLVDDEKANLKLLNELLRDELNIILANNGEQAINKAKAFLPDLILLDVVMPKMSGFDTFRQLQKIAATQHIPVIFITGLNSTENEETGLTLGAVDYIRKPFNAQVVKARVATQLKIIKQRQELEQVGEKLAQASKIKSQFLANMSHEIRTPLSAIIGYTESILENEVEASEQHKIVSIIHKNGQHLLTLVNDILDISRIEADKLSIESIPVNLIKLLEEVELLVIDQATAKQLKFSFDYQLPLPTKLLTDPTRLKQILLNLISNAIKFTKTGFVEVKISVNESQLVLSVNDSGIGIKPEQGQKLFEVFNQGSSQITRNYGGTGLGLTISKHLANKLGGDLSFESEYGKGSLFTANVALELTDDAKWLTSEQALLDEVSRQSDKTNAQQQFVGDVLLAEDNKELRKLFSLMLKKLGLTVTAVSNGEQLVEAGIANEYDLIITDINMPVMTGLEAVLLLKQASSMTPCVALTANAMSHEVQSYLAAGFDAHIAKPVNRKQFITVLSRYITPNSEPELENDDTLKVCQVDFVNELPNYKEKIVTAYSADDWQQLQFEMHSLHGAAAVFEFSEISKITKNIESGLANNEFPQHKSKMSAQLIDLYRLIDLATQ